MTKRLAIIIGLILTLVGAAIYVRAHIEFPGDRPRVAKEIQALASRFKSGDSRALDGIISYLDGDWPFARMYAACTVGQIGPTAKRAVPALIRSLNCGNDFVEREAARALGSVGIGMPEVVEPLEQKMRVVRNDAAIFSAESLGNIGEPAIIAIPDLQVAATSQFKWMRETANESLTKLRALKSGMPLTVPGP